jgi:hypothetical protein
MCHLANLLNCNEHQYRHVVFVTSGLRSVGVNIRIDRKEARINYEILFNSLS